MNKIIAIIGFVMVLASCTEMIEQEPQSSIGAGSFWKTEDDANGALNGIYDRLREAVDYEYFNWSDIRGEYYTNGLQAPEGYEYYYENRLSPTNAGTQWKGLYTVLHECNLMLKYVDGITFNDEAEKDILKAQAYGVRAYVNFIIARTWGDAPLRLDPTEGLGGDLYQKRMPVAQLFGQIDLDIDAALDLVSGNTISDKYYMSRPAIKALQAEVALHKARVLNEDVTTNLDLAIAALNEVEQSSSVNLTANYASIFDEENKRNEEIIWSIPFIDLEETGNIGDKIYVRGDQMPPGANDTLQGAGLSRFAYKREMCEKFAANDPRANATFVLLLDADGEYYMSLSRKYDGKYFANEGSRKFVSDVILYRVGEIILMKAEAYLAKGEYKNAITEMNRIRFRVNQPDYDGAETAEAVSTALLNEYMFETMGEGKRWWQMIRFGGSSVAKALIEEVAPGKYVYNSDVPMYFPLSEGTISLNPELGQTVGY